MWRSSSSSAVLSRRRRPEGLNLVQDVLDAEAHTFSSRIDAIRSSHSELLNQLIKVASGVEPFSTLPRYRSSSDSNCARVETSETWRRTFSTISGFRSLPWPNLIRSCSDPGAGRPLPGKHDISPAARSTVLVFGPRPARRASWCTDSSRHRWRSNGSTACLTPEPQIPGRSEDRTPKAGGCRKMCRCRAGQDSRRTTPNVRRAGLLAPGKLERTDGGTPRERCGRSRADPSRVRLNMGRVR